jgi:CRP-like cAMP-binding protein
VANQPLKHTDTSTVQAPQRGPSLRAIPFLRLAGFDSEPVELLSEAQRQQIARRARLRHFAARAVIYTAGAPADAIFIIASGVVKSFRDLPSGRRRIAAFLFERDLFGLAANGHYVNTVQAVTPVDAYQVDMQALTQLFQSDSDLELQFLCKTVHVLRESQHHNIIIGRHDAAGRLAMMLRLLEKQSASGAGQGEVSIPMTRSDIANYLGLSLEAVVRASRRLERDRIVRFSRHSARILDRDRFDALVSNL